MNLDLEVPQWQSSVLLAKPWALLPLLSRMDPHWDQCGVKLPHFNAVLCSPRTENHLTYQWKTNLTHSQQYVSDGCTLMNFMSVSKTLTQQVCFFVLFLSLDFP